RDDGVAQCRARAAASRPATEAPTLLADQRPRPTGSTAMDFGASMFFTDYSMTSMELAQALQARGFESVWAPEDSHIPPSRRSPFPGGGDLPKQYYDAMDPFVTLTAA